MKTCILIIFTACALATAAQAQNESVVWQTPLPISGPSDVNTQGTYYGTWAPYDVNANTLPVNGVAFQGFCDLPSFNTSFPQGDQSGYDGFNDPNTPDTNYNTLLETGAFADSGDGTIVISWQDTPGRTYLIQAWANDGSGDGLTETFTSGTNTSASLDFGDAPGQYIIGTYVADGSGSVTLTLSGADSPGGDYPQINLMQVRDITTNDSADVAWQTPVTISGTSDVVTEGAYFGSWAPQDANAPDYPVNGVSFQGFSDLPDLGPGATLDNGYNGFDSPNTPDSDYNTLLQYAQFSNQQYTPATFSWGGMTPGNTYLVEFWVNDGRNIGQNRTETLTGGTSVSSPVSYGSIGEGPGQYIIGTFVANSTGQETLAVTAYSSGPNPSVQINIFQVRDITAIVTSSAPKITSLGVSGTTLTMSAINGPQYAPCVLLASSNLALPMGQWTPVLTNAFDSNGNFNLSASVVNPNHRQEFYALKAQ
jgi:ankyrin repeat protein